MLRNVICAKTSHDCKVTDTIEQRTSESATTPPKVQFVQETKQRDDTLASWIEDQNLADYQVDLRHEFLLMWHFRPVNSTLFLDLKLPRPLVATHLSGLIRPSHAPGTRYAAVAVEAHDCEVLDCVIGRIAVNVMELHVLPTRTAETARVLREEQNAFLSSARNRSSFLSRHRSLVKCLKASSDLMPASRVPRSSEPRRGVRLSYPSPRPLILRLPLLDIEKNRLHALVGDDTQPGGSG